MPRRARSSPSELVDRDRRGRRAASCVVGLKQPGQPSVQPWNQTTNRAPGPLARLRGSNAWIRTRPRSLGRACGSTGAGRSPAVEPPTSISLSSRSGVTMPLSMPPDGTKPSSVPPLSRSWSWLSVAARKLYDGELLRDAEHVLPRADRDLGELDAAHQLLLAVRDRPCTRAAPAAAAADRCS